MRKLWTWLKELRESLRYDRESDDYEDYEDYEDDEEMEECEEDKAEKQHRIPPRKLHLLGQPINKKAFQRNSQNKSPPKQKGAILWSINFSN